MYTKVLSKIFMIGCAYALLKWVLVGFEIPILKHIFLYPSWNVLAIPLVAIATYIFHVGTWSAFKNKEYGWFLLYFLAWPIVIFDAATGQFEKQNKKNSKP